MDAAAMWQGYVFFKALGRAKAKNRNLWMLVGFETKGEFVFQMGSSGPQ